MFTRALLSSVLTKIPGLIVRAPKMLVGAPKMPHESRVEGCACLLCSKEERKEEEREGGGSG